ncbi:hypothetical protein SSP24_01140 [Streptomyces spinoverrucosus]|uniref:Pyridine nucleotide-disulphide oxidoreductase N-terminal domain-containing protein n=1 Tax=Streptomyces spinoverrucosus TaxID=284043 RepID=A0A4Y3V9Y6_9ACTN|nr:hypothetical protein SSP24_01140 [Streptomyces spinoverrucosus]GHB42843.1 hypothetical protein GCM10010397_11450 [Streptomyces spinoverrucosus]
MGPCTSPRSPPTVAVEMATAWQALGSEVTMLVRGAGLLARMEADGAELAADEILFATGRAPRTADLGLETIGLTPGTWVTVDDTCWVTAVAVERLWHAVSAFPTIIEVRLRLLETYRDLSAEPS